MANIISALISASSLCLLLHIGTVDLVNMASGAAPETETSENGAGKDQVVAAPGTSNSALPAPKDANEEHPVCPSPTVHTVKNYKFAASVSNCTCECAEGKLGWYRNGTACFTLHLGYNNEMTAKNGKCYSGKCVVDYIPFGCNKDKHQNLSIPKNESDGGPPVGCAFLCSVQNKDEGPFHYEYGHYPLGTVCRHVKNPGNYTDGPPREWTGIEYVNATCRSIRNETLCREEGEVPEC
ncbi:uncharacterized protein LOC144137644 [Haemaphysalis longicornis]